MVNRDRHSKAYTAIVECLVARRRELGLTQAQLAARMGTDQSQISKFERGERRIDIIDFARICVALELDPGMPLKAVPLRPFSD